MAVHTPITRKQLTDFLSPYALGNLRTFKGIEGGVENSNFFVFTDQRDCPNPHYHVPGEYVLTIFELVGKKSLVPFMRLIRTLANNQLPVPVPYPDNKNQTLNSLVGKPTVIFPRLSGHHVHNPNAHQCAAIGSFLGQMHRLTENQSLHREDLRGVDWIRHEPQKIENFLEGKAQLLFRQVLTESFSFIGAKPDLPKGIIHGDLFCDNALFIGDQLSGVIDFYNAYSDYLLYDLAIIANNWCCNHDGSMNTERCRALLNAYHKHRQFKHSESEAWPILLRMAALRFWVMRLIAMYLPPSQTASSEASLRVIIKNPFEFQTILQDRVNTTYSLDINS